MDDVSTQVRTFLIADVRGYTRFTQERGDEEAAKLASKFAVVVREEITAHDGEAIELRGDEALAVFLSARQTLRTAVQLQERFAGEVKQEPDLQMAWCKERRGADRGGAGVCFKGRTAS